MVVKNKKVAVDARAGHIQNQIDFKILDKLQQEGRITNADLASYVGLSPSAMLRRVQILEEENIISYYTARLNPIELGYQGSVFVHVSLTSQSKMALEAFESAVLEVSEIMECYLMAGESDYLMRVLVGNMSDYERFHIETLTNLPYVARIQSLFSLKTVIRKTALPIFHQET